MPSIWCFFKLVPERPGNNLDFILLFFYRPRVVLLVEFTQFGARSIDLNANCCYLTNGSDCKRTNEPAEEGERTGLSYCSVVIAYRRPGRHQSIPPSSNDSWWLFFFFFFFFFWLWTMANSGDLCTHILIVVWTVVGRTDGRPGRAGGLKWTSSTIPFLFCTHFLLLYSVCSLKEPRARFFLVL